jgi:hypothetical protein
MWDDDIRMDLEERGWKGMDWINLAQDRDKSWAVMKEAMNLQVPLNTGNLFTS